MLFVGMHSRDRTIQFKRQRITNTSVPLTPAYLTQSVCRAARAAAR
jgi:hypothetical protein